MHIWPWSPSVSHPLWMMRSFSQVRLLAPSKPASYVTAFGKCCQQDWLNTSYCSIQGFVTLQTSLDDPCSLFNCLGFSSFPDCIIHNFSSSFCLPLSAAVICSSPSSFFFTSILSSELSSFPLRTLDVSTSYYIFLFQSLTYFDLKFIPFSFQLSYWMMITVSNCIYRLQCNLDFDFFFFLVNWMPWCGSGGAGRKRELSGFSLCSFSKSYIFSVPLAFTEPYISFFWVSLALSFGWHWLFRFTIKCRSVSNFLQLLIFALEFLTCSITCVKIPCMKFPLFKDLEWFLFLLLCPNWYNTKHWLNDYSIIIMFSFSINF